MKKQDVAGNTEYFVGKNSTPRLGPTTYADQIESGTHGPSAVTPLTMIPGSDHSKVTETPVSIGNKVPDGY